MDSLKQIISSVAPFLGSILGGPIGGSAGSLLSTILTGKDNSSEQEIINAFKNATPEMMIRIKEIDSKYKEKILDTKVQVLSIESADRDSARKRQMALNDKMPAVLAITTTLAFFTVLILCIFFPIPPSSKDIVEILIGALTTVWISAMAYYLGTSHGSLVKTHMISEKNNLSTS